MGVAALSGAIDATRLELGVAGLRRAGFEPTLAANLASRHGLFAGTDDERLAAFHQLAADPELKAVFFARGGHGILRLLDRIDWDLLGETPRAYVGYSDLTPFLDQVVRRTRRVAFHGPMVAAEFAREMESEERQALFQMLAGDLPYEVPVRRVAGAPMAEGRLMGGCLSLLVATLGTDYAPSLDGAILFWEDVHEPIYRLDRMLTQLRLSGCLAGVRGMVVGRLEAADGSGSVEQMLEDLSGDFDGPIVRDCSSGHCRPNLTLPIGAQCRLDADGGRLIFDATGARS